MKKITLLLLSIALISGLMIGLSSKNQAQINTQIPIKQELKNQWRLMNEGEKNQEIRSLIDHKMGIAALNQLALEGFISYDCEKSFYINEPYGGFQTLLRIKCNTPTGASSAISFNEVRVIFNRFEGNIENFEIQRIGEEVDQSTFNLPD